MVQGQRGDVSYKSQHFLLRDTVSHTLHKTTISARHHFVSHQQQFVYNGKSEKNEGPLPEMLNSPADGTYAGGLECLLGPLALLVN